MPAGNRKSSLTLFFRSCFSGAPKDEGPPGGGPSQLRGRSRDHILAIIACPKPEHDSCVAPCISRAKS
jgi:hypothetical protein